MNLTHLSLFSGIGGLDLAAEMAGFQTVGQCEWADYPTKVLEKHWPDVPKWRDVRKLTGEDFREKTGLKSITVVSGGFPCQPHSLSGKRLASRDKRDLWSELFRVFCETNARWLVGENVPGLLSSENGRFSEEYLGTWPKWGVMYGGTVFQPMRSVQSFGVSESHLWPRPIASDSVAWTKCRACNPRITIVKMWERHGQDRPIYDFMWHGLSVTQAAEFHEMMMGFPPHWTDLNVSEMR